MLAINSFVDNGRFQIIDTLGKGGSGICYLALDTHSSSQKHYAIKCVPRPKPRHTYQTSSTTSPSSSSSSGGSSAAASTSQPQPEPLLREIRLHKQVSGHPGVVGLKRCVAEGPFMLLIMDYVPGGDLFKQITQQHRYFLNDALISDIFLQIVDAVEHCHAQGVYHRDLKPENILCNAEGTRVVLADFGLATRQTSSDDLGVGSGYYMSPECTMGPAYSTEANDVWSLGVVICNLVYGRNPWAQAVPTDATFAAYCANTSYLSSILPVPPAVNRILRGVFALDPRQRWSLAKLKAEAAQVNNWVMNEDELRLARSEARAVAGVLRDCARGREERVRREERQRQMERMREAQVAAYQAHQFHAQQQQFQQIVVEQEEDDEEEDEDNYLPPPAPTAFKAPKTGLRLMFSKFAQHAQAPTARTAASSASTATSASTASSMDSPMPLTPPVNQPLPGMQHVAGYAVSPAVAPHHQTQYLHPVQYGKFNAKAAEGVEFPFGWTSGDESLVQRI